MPQTCADRSTRMYTHGTYSKRIRHTRGTLRASRKILSKFKKKIEPKRAGSAQRLTETYINVHQAYTKRIKRACNALLYITLLAYTCMLNFTFLSNTPGARLAYTQMWDCCLSTVNFNVLGYFVMNDQLKFYARLS